MKAGIVRQSSTADLVQMEVPESASQLPDADAVSLLHPWLERRQWIVGSTVPELCGRVGVDVHHGRGDDAGG